MNFDLYQLDRKANLAQISLADASVAESLKKIEEEIIREFLSQQAGRIGIKNLGEQLRKNKTLKSIFGIPKNGSVIVKMTENKRSFLKIFVRSVAEYSKQRIYFFIFHDEFGVQSNIVDKTFPRLYEIENELSVLFRHFEPKHEWEGIYFVEMKGFGKYNLVDIDGYSKIEEIN